MLDRLRGWFSGTTKPGDEPVPEIHPEIRAFAGAIGKRLFELSAPTGRLDTLEFCWNCAIVAGRAIGRLDRTYGGAWVETVHASLDIDTAAAAELQRESAATLPTRKDALLRKVRDAGPVLFAELDPLLAHAGKRADAIAFLATTQAFIYAAKKFAHDEGLRRDVIFATMIDLSSVAAIAFPSHGLA